MSSPVVVVEVVRSGFVECRHYGSVVEVGPDGQVRSSVGDTDSQIYPRSSNKPIQALAMVRAGLPVRGALLAQACASHGGEPFQLRAVRELLASAGLDEHALQTPPDYPADEQARIDYLRAGHERSSIAMNCSGKHAAMLATCGVNGWPIDTYRDLDHPLQRAILRVFEELTGEPVGSVGVDGCGAPLLSTSLVGLARAFGRLVQAESGTAEADVTGAIVEFPEYVSGTRNPDAALLRAFPGAIGKSGAEACHALALPDGTAFACKIDDGGQRARPVVLAEAIRRAGYANPVLDQLTSPHVLGGDQAVGRLRPVF